MGAAQGQKTPAGHAAVLQLLQTIGEAYSLLSKYHCQVRTLSLLPPNLCCSQHTSSLLHVDMRPTGGSVRHACSAEAAAQLLPTYLSAWS